MLDNRVQERKARLANKGIEKDPELKYWYRRRVQLVNELEIVNTMYRNKNSNGEGGSNSRMNE
jgi:hypothetical protein